MSLAAARSRQTWMALFKTSLRRPGARAILPCSESCSMRDRLKRSSMISLRRSACLAMICKKFRAFSGSCMAPSSRVSTNPLMEVMGVLSSWETLATKSRRACSRRRNRVTSLSTMRAPKAFPWGSREGCRGLDHRALPPENHFPVHLSRADERVTKFWRSGLRTTSGMGRSWAVSGSTPSSRAPAWFRVMRRSSGPRPGRPPPCWPAPPPAPGAGG